MKKVILGLLSVLAVLTFAGCQAKENIKLDLNKIASELDTLAVNKVDYQFIYFEDMPGYTSELEMVYDLSKLGLDGSLVEESKIYYNEESKEFFAVISPMDGKTEEIKSQLNSFVTSINAEVEEINGLLIYASSTDNQLVFKTIKEMKVSVFGMMMEVTKDQIKDTLNVEEADVEEFLMKMPMMGQASKYIIVKPVSGKEEVVKNAIDEYMANEETQWSMYLPDQYELVKNRKVEKIGDYLIYIVSTDNNSVFETIKNNKIVAE